MTHRRYNGKSIPVRVYTTKGLKEQARFALECAHRTVDYFSEVFEIEYPLPKADLLAVHEFVSLSNHTSLDACIEIYFVFPGHGSYGELGPCNIPNDCRSLR